MFVHLHEIVAAIAFPLSCPFPVPLIVKNTLGTRDYEDSANRRSPTSRRISGGVSFDNGPAKDLEVAFAIDQQ